MSTTVSESIITWEKLPDDFPLPDDPVDNINQPLLAAALTESLELAGRIQPSMLIGTNFSICATVDGFLVVKAPDWFYAHSCCQPSPPTNAIFEPEAGWLEVYQLDASGRYQLQQQDANGRYWIAGIGLFLGVWQGNKANRTGYWLRWWDEAGQMLLWGTERLQHEQQLRERMAAKLSELGVNPADI